MTTDAQLAEDFERQRPRLLAMAHRVLGARSDAEDVVQDAWLRLSRQDAEGIDNLAGWLTTVISRLCIDTLRSRASRPEVPIDHASACAASWSTASPGCSAGARPDGHSA